MASDGEALTELCLEDWWWATKNQQHDNGTPDSELEVFRITRDWLQAYFADERRLDIKAELLEHEGVDMTRFDLPNIRLA